jgi:PERQ amino acid-rich with GYF domain-containing protein
MTSPTNTKLFRDDNPTSPPLVRRRTDLKEGVGPHDRPWESKDSQDTSPFATITRRSTAGQSNVGFNGPASPWGSTPQSATFSPMGAFGSILDQAAEKKPGYTSLRGESRFSKLISRDSNENMKGPKERTSFGNLERVNEGQQERAAQNWRLRGMSDTTDPYGGEDGESSQPRTSHPGMETPSTRVSRENFGFADLGMSSTEGSGFRQQNENSVGQEPYSPTETNPYTSPAAEKEDSEDIDTGDSEFHIAHHPDLGGISGEGPNVAYMNFNRMSGNDEGIANRSRTSSAGQNRGFRSLGGLGGIGNMPGWPGPANPSGTPDKERPGFSGAFGNSVFGPMGDLQSSGVGSLPSASAGRGSKLGSLFPPAMQAQMQTDGSNQEVSYEMGEGSRVGNQFAAPGLGNPGKPSDSPLRTSRGMFDDLNFSSKDANRDSHGSDLSSSRAENSTQSKSGQSANPQSREYQQAAANNHPTQHGQGTGSVTSQSTQPPSNQQRMMVMPDRIRWIYRDPQGSTQGPWSGLEMHDWYKAGFFTPDLMVKKVEDSDYEPLGQLIRRIGNSREPFLVPQIGIPHGPPSTQPASQWSAAGAAPVSVPTSVTSGSVQPPFAGAFPSFGTTLTAEQQNALERRKQEEQYLMARQKEYLAQQQVLQKHQMGIGGAMGAGQLQHHSSAHSLQSQPSFGSITSPGAFPTPPQGPPQSQQGLPFLDSQLRQVGSLGSLGGNADISVGSGLREEDIPALLNRINLGRDGQQFGSGSFGQLDSSAHSQQVAAMLAQRAQLQREQAQHDLRQIPSAEADQFNERLQQFNSLQRHQEERQSFRSMERLSNISSQHEENRQSRDSEHAQYQSFDPKAAQDRMERGNVEKPREVLSLSQQVQKAAAKQPMVPAPQPQSPWGKIDSSTLPQPFSPPQSSSPLPAPSAQRNRHNLPESLVAETHSRSGASSVDTPSASVAPWARESSEGLKGPSLRQIQEVEARKAARAEGIAAASRRAAQEQERLIQSTMPAAAPGLPSSSTWGSSGSPATPTAPGQSAWMKPLAGKPTATQGGVGMKKTLSQIQKEEEARKQKAAQASLSAAAYGQSSISAGKRYADLAGKTAAPPSGSSGAWTTVGSGGAKAKTGPSPAVVATPPTNMRSISGGIPSNVSTPKARPSVFSPKSSAASGQSSAKDELTKWAKNTLSGRMNQGINGMLLSFEVSIESDIFLVDNFVQQLVTFPADLELIKEGVHGNSETVNAQHFAEEFVRRRRLADKGIIESASSTGTSSSPGATNEIKADGGWSAVAKKGNVPNAKEENSPFKVVASKKKGKK